MSTQTHRKICVILGAGASYDVHDAGSSLLEAGLRPPLARDLFDFDEHDHFRSILAEYEGAVVLAQSLANKSRQPDFDIETELRRIAEHPSGQLREHYKHIPPYLRDLLTVCSYGYTSYPSCYVQLVQALLAEEPSEVLFLVLNYDDLLEQALYRFSAGAIRFENLEDYVREDRPAKVIKLHGSINWFNAIGPLNDEWKTRVRTVDVLAKAPDTFHVVTRNGRTDTAFTYQIEVSGQRVYPVLTAPLAGKGPTAMVCPGRHLATATEFLRDCSRFLVIGASGFDDDLLCLLGNSIQAKRPTLQFVSGSEAEGRKVLQRFASKVGRFGTATSRAGGTLAFDGGFREYVTTDAILKFLRQE